MAGRGSTEEDDDDKSRARLEDDGNDRRYGNGSEEGARPRAGVQREITLSLSLSVRLASVLTPLSRETDERTWLISSALVGVRVRS